MIIYGAWGPELTFDPGKALWSVLRCSSRLEHD